MNIQDLPNSVVQKRLQAAKLEQMELAIEKERIALEDKKRNICRIDVALESFDNFLKDFIEMMRQIPDRMQSIDPALTPEMYKEIQQFIDDQIQRMGEKRLYLGIESTRETAEMKTEANTKSAVKSVRIRKKS